METPNQALLERYRLAGWVCVASAVVGTPLIIVAIAQQGSSGPLTAYLEFGHAFLVCVHIWLLLTFRGLLNYLLGFHRVDGLITVLIAFSLLLILILPLQSLDLFRIVVIPMAFVEAIVSIVFAIRLLEVSTQLYGLKLYSIALIVGNALAATVILIPLAFLVGIVSELAMAAIFFRASNSASVAPVVGAT